VGTATFTDAGAMAGVIEGMGAFMQSHGMRDLASIRGIVR
jgi:hypothetical protein